MKKGPLISVVLPVYNCASYIEEAINSILNQTITDFELIIIDDASTDKTLTIVQNIQDSRIKIITKEQNLGLIHSLNLGFELAKGKYIARMDGDDINLPERFEKQVVILEEKSDIKACGCWLQSFGAYNILIEHKETHKEIQSHLLLSNPMSLGATMLDRKAYESFRFLEDKIHVEDYDFWARSAWACPMYNIQEILYYYRVHNNQVSTKYKSIQLKGDVEIKLSLYQKLQYNRAIYSDELISKLLYTNNSFNIQELKLILDWFTTLIKNNKRLKVFDYSEFKKVIFKIRRKLLFDIFFTNNGEGIDYNLRKKIFQIVPINEKIFVLKKKIYEKFKTFFR